MILLSCCVLQGIARGSGRGPVRAGQGAGYSSPALGLHMPHFPLHWTQGQAPLTLWLSVGVLPLHSPWSPMTVVVQSVLPCCLASAGILQGTQNTTTKLLSIIHFSPSVLISFFLCMYECMYECMSAGSIT